MNAKCFVNQDGVQFEVAGEADYPDGANLVCCLRFFQEPALDSWGYCELIGHRFEVILGPFNRTVLHGEYLAEAQFLHREQHPLLWEHLPHNEPEGAGRLPVRYGTEEQQQADFENFRLQFLSRVVGLCRLYREHRDCFQVADLCGNCESPSTRSSLSRLPGVFEDEDGRVDREKAGQWFLQWQKRLDEFKDELRRHFEGYLVPIEPERVRQLQGAAFNLVEYHAGLARFFYKGQGLPLPDIFYRPASFPRLPLHVCAQAIQKDLWEGLTSFEADEITLGSYRSLLTGENSAQNDDQDEERE